MRIRLGAAKVLICARVSGHRCFPMPIRGRVQDWGETDANRVPEQSFEEPKKNAASFLAGRYNTLKVPFIRLSENQRHALQFEVVPSEARLEFTRIIRDRCSVEHGDQSGGIALLRENEFINIANQVLGKPIYTLQGDDWGEYHPAEHAWHHGQRELIMRLPSTPQLAEILADYLQRGMMMPKDINAILEHYNCGFRFHNRGDDIEIEISAPDAIPEIDLSQDHPNVRKLVLRMEAALNAGDFAGVLHASASIFETLAKDVMITSTVNDQPLGAFFAGYRKKSLLPGPVLDYMLEVYKARNTQPLAGHGSLSPPTVDAAQAIVLSELTKSIVRIERSLAEQQIDLGKTSSAQNTSSQTAPYNVSKPSSQSPQKT